LVENPISVFYVYEEVDERLKERCNEKFGDNGRWQFWDCFFITTFYFKDEDDLIVFKLIL